jgi:tRNA pseudouridine55 synthase
LPLAIGEATKAFDYIASTVKEYRFTITFGESRDTDDSEGVVTASTEVIPDQSLTENVLAQFTGRIMQVPPAYSALKVNGQRAYKRARAGEEVVMTARSVDIYALKQVAYDPPCATFEVSCGKGTYVRSLARDIAIQCNSLGYVSALRRTVVGKFREDKAISLEKLASSVHNAALFGAWVPIESALGDIPAIHMDSELTQKLRHGQALGTDNPDGTYMALHQGQIVALVEADSGRLRSLRIFNLT